MTPGRAPHFAHERLDVYRKALAFLTEAEAVAARMPRSRAFLSEQLRSAAASVTLNIAEAAGEFAPKEKARIYRIALRSATECAAALDVARSAGLVQPMQQEAMRLMLHDVVAMLTRLSLLGRSSGEPPS